jgi:hypothetical protein
MEDTMKALRIPFFASVDDIIKMAKDKQGKHKKITFAQFPDRTIRLIIMNGTINDPEDFDENNCL